jgi:protein-disulfide isomerase
LPLTRREFLNSVSAFALLAGVVAAAGQAGLSLVSEARAQTVPMDQLMAPQALPDQALGKPDAPVTIVEYASMTCPHCAHFHTTVYPELKKRYIDTGKVRFIFREFPLDRLAAAGSLLARCAGEGDKFFGVIELLFENQNKWAGPGVRKPLPPLMDLMKQAGFTQQTFEKCLADTELLKKIEQEREDAAKKYKVDSTPTLFLNGTKVASGVSIEELGKQIDALVPKS